MRFLKLPLSCKIQLILWYFGIAVHNPFRDECTPDFNCCTLHEKKIGRRSFLRFGNNINFENMTYENRNVLKELTLAAFQKLIDQRKKSEDSYE